MAYNHGREDRKWRIWKEAEEKLLRESDGTRDIQVILSNHTNIPLSGSGKTVKLALYKDAMHKNMLGEELTITDTAALADIDNDICSVVRTIDVTELYSGDEIPEEGLRVYAHAWVVDTDEPSLCNNDSFIRFKGLLTKSNGEKITTDAVLDEDNGAYTAYADIRNNSMQTAKLDLPVAVLLDSKGRVLAKEKLQDNPLVLQKEERKNDLSATFTAVDGIPAYAEIRFESQEVFAVFEMINALPAAPDVTVDDKDDIKAAREAYDALTDAQKALIAADTLKKLTDDEVALAAAKVTALINALPAAVTIADREAVEAARAAYDALTDAQKVYISDETLAKLKAAEDSLKVSVKWIDGNGNTIRTDMVTIGKTPEYTGETPTKAETNMYTYTFTGWTPEITAVTEDTEYTATFEAVAKHLFAAHSITLGGDVGVNFYIDPAVVGADIAKAESAIVKFSFAKYTSVVNLKELKHEANGWYKVTCNIPAAYMAHKIHAVVYINGVAQDETNDYSVQEYAETILANPSKYDSEKPDALAALVKEMLNYGKKAQTVFSAQMDTTAEYDEIADYTMADVTAEMIQNAIDSDPANAGKTATDMSTVHPEAGATYYTSSLIFLSKSTLRHYFAVPGGSANASAYDGNQSDYYYYVEKTNIPVTQLDDYQEFSIGNTTFYYSALDYAKAIVSSDKMSEDQKDLAKALYLYNRAANVYFPD